MSQAARLTLNKTSEGVWQLAGEMTMYGVSDARHVLLRNRPTQGAWIVEGRQLKSVDSAGLALILDMMRYARDHNITLTVRGLPAIARELVEVQGLISLFSGVEYVA